MKKIPVKKVLIISGSVILLVFVCMALWFLVLRPGKALSEAAANKHQISRGPSKGLFLSTEEDLHSDVVMAYMYDTTVSDRMFKGQFGIEPDSADKVYTSSRMFTDNVKNMLERDKEDFPSYVILGIDPYKTYLQSCSNRNMYTDSYSYIMDLADENPLTAFIIEFPDYGKDYWNSLSASEKEDARTSYILPVRMFSEYKNVWFYYHASYEWILYSDAIRDTERGGVLKESFANHLFQADVADRSLSFMLTMANVNSVMDSVIEMSSDYENVKNSYADMSGKKVLFFGDSVFGNYRDETSVSSFFAEMTGAKTYNISKGGMASVNVIRDDYPITYAYNYLIGKTDAETFEKECSDLDAYNSFRLAKHDLEETDNSDIIFIVEFGLNEYFCGVSPEEYGYCIGEIAKGFKEAYPGSTVILLAPGYISYCNYGLDIQEPEGQPLYVYTGIVPQVAYSVDAKCLSLAGDFGFNQFETWNYLNKDGVHYNENGRYLIAQYLAKYFKNSKT